MAQRLTPLYIQAMSSLTRGTLYAVNVLNGALLFSFNVGPRLHSHPVRDLSDDVNLDKFCDYYNRHFVPPLNCPRDAHIVLNRIVYVCPELTIVQPTQSDLCHDLERPCVKVKQLISCANQRNGSITLARLPIKIIFGTPSDGFSLKNCYSSNLNPTGLPSYEAQKHRE